MKIFVSWSGKLSRKTAECLKAWLTQKIFPTEELEIFVSSEDIGAGVNWYTEIRTQLMISDMAIICLTKENMSKPWLTFEAGAILGSKDEKRAIPLLIDFEPSTLSGPLKAAQAITLTSDQLVKLAQGIIEVGKFTSLSQTHVKPVVEGEFQRLKKEIEDAKSEIEGDSYSIGTDIFPAHVQRIKRGKVFLGSPMASTRDDVEYAKTRNSMLDLKRAIETHCGVREVYYPGERIIDKSGFDGKKSALVNDFKILKESEYFVFYYPSLTASSVLLEVGYVIGLSRRTIIFTEQRDNLPFMLQQADKAISLVDIYECNSINEMISIVSGNGYTLFS